MKNKIIALLVVLLSLTACGSKSDDEPIKVSFWHVYSENFGAPVINEMVEAFNKSQDEIVVEAVYNPDMYPGLMQNLQAEVASGEVPSIAMIGYNYLKYFAENFPYVSPEEITEKIVSEDANYLSDTYLDNILDLARVDGDLVGIPFSISTPILYYNADLFEEAGLDPNKAPETWEDVQEFALKIKESSGKYGFYMQEYADNWAIQGLLESNGAVILSDEGKASFASPESEEAYQVLADMVLEDKSALHITAEEGIQSFINGEVGIFVGTSAKIGQIEEGSDFDLRGGEFPVFAGKDRKIPAGGNFLPILAQDEAEQKAAWEFIKFIMEPEWLAKWTQNTGYLPPREDVAQDAAMKEYISEHQLLEIAFDEMDTISPWAAFPQDIGPRAEQLFADIRDEILGGEVKIKDALQNAQNKLNEWLD